MRPPTNPSEQHLGAPQNPCPTCLQGHKGPVTDVAIHRLHPSEHHQGAMGSQPEQHPPFLLVSTAGDSEVRGGHVQAIRGCKLSAGYARLQAVHTCRQPLRILVCVFFGQGCSVSAAARLLCGYRSLHFTKDGEGR